MTIVTPFPGNAGWPAEWQGSRVTGRFLDTLGAPMKGTVTFRPSAGAVIAAASKIIVIGVSKTVTLDITGAFDILLPATDDPDLNPTGFTYAVVEGFSGGRSYSIAAPMNAVQDLSTLVPVPAAAGVPIVRGKSAYEVAVDQGFVGTEAEWLASLGGSGGGGTVVDATSTVKGVVKLTGDLAGTAASPTVPGLADKAPKANPTFTGTVTGVTKAHVGLASAEDTADADKPVSNATAAAIAAASTTDRARGNHTGTQPATTITGLAAVATSGAKADVGLGLAENTSDLNKPVSTATAAAIAAASTTDRSRANHTGTQTAATISDFTEAAQDAVAAMLSAGTGVTLAYDDAGNSLTITAAGGGGGITDPETVRDVIGVALIGAGAISVVANDAGDTITITTTATANSTDAALRDRGTHTGSQSADTITDSATKVLFLPAERTKLGGIATGATANATDAQLRDRSLHTGTQSADTIVDSATKVLFLPAERTKLSGIATGATANDTDANLRARANHTGVQTAATISDFTEAVQDAVAALLGAGSNITLNYDDTGNTLTVTGAGPGLDAEAVRDAIGVAMVGVGNITVTVNDALDTITISTTATANSTDAQLRDRSTHTGTQAAATITGLATVATTGAYTNLTGKPLLVLGPVDSVPGGTAAGTVIIRTAT